ncbi:hypothetical protein [Bifidobacterium tsurumiense]|uniref:hypothetical protein n=1 Tax=Bifidobacterium tsurumiense TaxID=356829 RepID=UPI0012B1CBD9|nr:hypothetical protein [Bifidobacterium tsurumiense]MSS13020.1 hypothetical protein [Bifidobacterium tsurumiense]
MASRENHASNERKTLNQALKTLDFQARFFFTRWMSGVRVPHRPHFSPVFIISVCSFIKSESFSLPHCFITTVEHLGIRQVIGASRYHNRSALEPFIPENNVPLAVHAAGFPKS